MKLSLFAGPPPTSGPLVDAHAKMREPKTVAALLIGALALALVPLIPGVAPRLEVTVRDTSLAMGFFAPISLVATVAFHKVGPRPLYWNLSILETWATSASLLFLVWASGNPLSPFWILFGLTILVYVLEPTGRLVEGAAFLVTPLVLALIFLLSGATAKAAIVACVAAIANTAAVVLRSLFVGLTEARAERDRLRAENAELRLREERSRISRDLHDGLGTELASLTWSARTLHQRLEGTELQPEVGELLERLRSGMDELRSIVWALRAPRRSWDALVERLTVRCRELGTGAEVVVEASTDGDPSDLDGPLALDVIRAVQELVHNSARHASSRRIRVSLRRAAGAIDCSVEDDGRGLDAGALERSEGGLRNLSTRIQAAGGTVRIESAAPGTRVALRIPEPTVRPNMSMQ